MASSLHCSANTSGRTAVAEDWDKLAEPPKTKGDALDQYRGRQKMGKKEKQAYAKEKAMEELVKPPKNPPPSWLNDPNLLPKKPPGRK